MKNRSMFEVEALESNIYLDAWHNIDPHFHALGKSNDNIALLNKTRVLLCQWTEKVFVISSSKIVYAMLFIASLLISTSPVNFFLMLSVFFAMYNGFVFATLKSQYLLSKLSGRILERLESKIMVNNN